jgi:hypothetical protein
MPDFFERFGSVTHEKTYPSATPTESIAIDIAERWEEETPPGHGMFFDFSKTPELEQPILDYLTKGFGWKIENHGFIRKPLK